ncbi:hypothetical protein AGMB00912_00462 [Lactiplantibacillus argentoratensis]
MYSDASTSQTLDGWGMCFFVTTRAAGVEPAYQPKKEWASRLGLCSTVELHSHNPYPQLWSVEGYGYFV